MLVLLAAVATGAVAQETYKVSVKEGTEDATNWTITPAEATTTGVAAGTEVKATYNGTKKVKSVKAVKKAAAAPVVIDLSMVDCAGTARTDGQWTANCYMVHTAGDYKLPLVYGNAIKAGETNAAAYTGVTGNSNATATFPRHDGNAITAPWIKDNGITVTSAELLWQDADGLITAVGIDGDYLTLTVGTDAATQEGNAVVAAKDADGTIVWSWHIWVTTETFADNTLTTIATGEHNYKVTPVNLGWVPTSTDGKQGYNTYYQWGRKDPFKGMGTVSSERKWNITIADNIKNPTTHHYNSITDGPCNTTYYNMWDARQTSDGDNITTATEKTVYDPSPAGFCVPTGNLFHFITNGDTSEEGSWDNINKGRTFTSGTSNVFFPASGHRSNSNGSLGLVGSGGYYWSASASMGYNARNLYFDSSNWKWYYGNRVYGFTVRAVAEEE